MTALGNLAACLENLGQSVNTRLFWDAAHCIDVDPEGFIEWVGAIGH